MQSRRQPFRLSAHSHTLTRTCASSLGYNMRSIQYGISLQWPIDIMFVWQTWYLHNKNFVITRYMVHLYCWQCTAHVLNIKVLASRECGLTHWPLGDVREVCFSNSHLEHLLPNWSQLSATKPHWFSGTTPLRESMSTKFILPYGI